MTTNGPAEGDGTFTASTKLSDSSSATNTTLSSGEIAIIWIVSSVSAIVFLTVVLVCYKVTIRYRNSGNTHRQLDRSETCDLYQNSNTIRGRLAGDSLETLVNRPLPHPPEKNRLSAGIPAVPEDDYLSPITVDSIWRKHIEEIEKLPPAPPIFPGHLERLPLDGEGAYTPVIADDEAPLLSPGPMHEITLNQQLCELSEESGYMVPNSPTLISPQQNVTETDRSSEPRKIKRKGSEYQMVARAMVTSHEAKKRSLSESATVNSATQDETGKSKDSNGTIYRSTCQLYLSPPTQPRSPQPSTSTATVVVYINTKT
jgi:hypothetical protein